MICYHPVKEAIAPLPKSTIVVLNANDPTLSGDRFYDMALRLQYNRDIIDVIPDNFQLMVKELSVRRSLHIVFAAPIKATCGGIILTYATIGSR